MKTIHRHRGATVAVQLLCRPGRRVLRLQIKYRAGISNQEFVLKSRQRLPRLTVIAAETAPMPERKKSPTVETAGGTRQEDADGGNMVSGSLNRGCLNATGWLRCAHILPIHIWPEGIERNFAGRLSRQLDG